MRITTTARTGAIATLAAIGLTLPMMGAAAGPTTQAAEDGWEEIWREDFTGPAGSRLDDDRWIYDLGTGYPGGPDNWGTGEIETMTDSTDNVALDGDGNLRITPLRGSSGGWTSGRIESVRDDFEPAPDGVLRVEARIQLPDVKGAAAQGIWPAFWMLGEPYRGDFNNWPMVGEIDILENVNGTDSIYSTLHCGTNPGGPCNETIGLGGSTVCADGACQSGFHRYGFEWDRTGDTEQMRWYLDGSLFHTVDETEVDEKTWSDATEHGYFIILNVAVGGAWPGPPTAQTASGVPMIVDYVSVHRSMGPAPGPEPTVTPEPTATPEPEPTATPEPTPDPEPDGVSAFDRIEAERFDAQRGVGVEGAMDAGGGENVGWIGDGDWLRFDQVDFGEDGARGFEARVASGVGGGRSGLVEVRLDDPAAAPVGTFAIASTGGWQSWRTVASNMSRVTGVHTVYVTFTSGQSEDYVNVNWLTFRR